MLISALPEWPGTSHALKPSVFLQTTLGTLFCGDALSALRAMPPNTVDCIIGSPPYFSVRDYEAPDQIGLEETVESYLNALLAVYDEARRVLKPEGSCWVVIGDLYIEKNLALVPARFAIGMQDRGWIVRNDVIWKKSRQLPHPVKDRLINTHEHIFHFVKQRKYFYDLDSIRVPHAESSLNRVKSPIRVSHKGRYGADHGNRGRTIDALDETSAIHPAGRNPGDVFQAAPSTRADGHLATYPESLVEPRIKSTCPRDGVVLDFWMGSGTTALAAARLNRRWIGVELNPAYCEIAARRILEPLQPSL